MRARVDLTLYRQVSVDEVPPGQRLRIIPKQKADLIRILLLTHLLKKDHELL
jgi:hypothetical protein